MAIPQTSGERLSRWTMASYGAPALPLSMMALPLAVYLPAVYADSRGFGLSLGFVALMLALSRVFDGLTDPIVGFLSDRLRSRFGRRKPFILIGTPIFIAGVWLLWLPPITFGDVSLFGWTFNSGYPWLLGALVVMYVGSTIKDVPYSAFGAELARDYNQRTLVMSWREAFTVTGSLIGAFTPAILVFFGYTRPTDNVAVLTVFMAVLMPVLVGNLLISVPEPPVRETTRQRLRIRDSFRTVWANEPFRALVIIFLFATIGSAMTNSLSFFFVKHVLLAGDLYGFYLAPYFISQIIAIPFWFWLSRRIGKHRATMAAIFWYAFWSCFIPIVVITPEAWYAAFEVDKLLTFLPADAYTGAVGYFEGIPTGKFVFFIGVMMLKGSSIGALSALPAAMAADVIDVDSARTGKNQSGAYFSVWTMTRKLAYALGLLIGGVSVTWIGFDSLRNPIANPNTTAALLWLAVFYSIIPAVFKFVALPMLWRYELTEERVRAIQADIDTARAATATG
ncbi:MAG: MFS transporter [Pseudomonadales bacterium]|nr:MFS transporter [Pseudomonadales bacterium]MCP5185111.1 MFS transporter [Pseudomonadales bacterium]